MSLSPALSVGSYTHQYHDQGYLIYQHQGQAGKVCAEGLNTTLRPDQVEVLVHSLANTTCHHLQYRDMGWAAVAQDTEEGPVQYVRVGRSCVMTMFSNINLLYSAGVSGLWRV